IGVVSVRLMTNNPEKVAEMEKYGVAVAERVNHELPAHDDDRRYLETKKERFGHLLDLDHESTAE
ncbi:MAG TPA: bifunctional 3,4-dihydroxy-2-butanone-4-phosphate synthase/GTP cyclohydrolase II, partial [Treponemataceae bacterium]|nr:bifunctional 3,4-dihydroxy-2-butanone-4-phosphate synthase/GTP cyclohydrolase II [Treponemataceae bacterium]